MEQGDEDNAKTTSELHIEYDDYDDEYDEYDEDDEDLMIFLSFLVLPLREGFSYLPLKHIEVPSHRVMKDLAVAGQRCARWLTYSAALGILGA